MNVDFMNEPMKSPDAAWKAQQEANRAAREMALYSAAKLWQRQQEALAALATLRPQGHQQLPEPEGPSASEPSAAQ